jgi:transposase-like protein
MCRQRLPRLGLRHASTTRSASARASSLQRHVRRHPGTVRAHALQKSGSIVYSWDALDAGEQVRAAAGLRDDYASGQWSMSELCGRYGINRPTGYLWVDRYESGGAGLADRARAPPVVRTLLRPSSSGRVWGFGIAMDRERRGSCRCFNEDTRRSIGPREAR